MTAIPQLCERARGWSSARADDELSELESALLDSHLTGCGGCRDFAAGAATVAAVLRTAVLERPAPLAVVLPQRRPALQALKAVLAMAVVVAAGAAAALVGVDRTAAPGPAARRVAIVAGSESPDALRELRRPLLRIPLRPVPRNRRLPDESA
jgi:hypothetical protein